MKKQWFPKNWEDYEAGQRIANAAAREIDNSVGAALDNALASAFIMVMEGNRSKHEISLCIHGDGSNKFRRFSLARELKSFISRRSGSVSQDNDALEAFAKELESLAAMARKAKS